MTRPIAAVTGATGFVGGHVLAALTAAGWRLRILARRHPDLAPGGEPVEVVPGDLSDGAALLALVRGAQTVIHIAGAIKARGRAGFFAANADGTAAMAAAWREAAPEARLVMMSSLAAREPALSHYAASKAAGEAALREAGGECCILRPAAIYGPGDRETLTVFRAARLPLQPLLNGPEARLTLIHVGDVAAGVVAVAEERTPTGIFEMSDARHGGYSWREVVEAACAATGRRARPFRLPRAVLRAAGRIGDLGAALTGSAEMLTSQKVREALHPDWSSAAGAQLPAALWAPRIALDEGFAGTVAWYRAAGWLR